MKRTFLSKHTRTKHISFSYIMVR